MPIPRLISFGAVVGATLFLGSARVAHADPHALFYTAVGQQQLFFNMLAALDQADYVEPAIDNLGTPNADSRQELLDRRTSAGFSGEDNSQLNATKTELATILTRGVTLEGQDLWTAYVLHAQTLEAQRRNNVDHFLRMLCENGLGFANCEDSISERTDKSNTDGVKEQEERRKKAIDLDPVERKSQGIVGGIIGALFSSFNPQSADQQARTEANEKGSEQATTIPFDSSAAGLQEKNASQVAKRATIDRILLGAANVYLPPVLNTRALDNLTIDPSVNEVSLNAETSVLAEDPTYLNRYAGKIGTLANLPLSASEVAEQGRAKVEIFKEREEEQGFIATGRTNVKQLAGNSAPGQAVLGEVEGQVIVPAKVKADTVASGLNTLGSAEENLKYSGYDPNTPGDDELVHRDNNVAGAQSRNSTVLGANSGSVLGEFDDDVYYEDLADEHDPKPAIDPAQVNPAGVHHEQGAGHFLFATGYKSEFGGCGCHVRDVVNDHGQALIRRINNFGRGAL